MKSTSRKRISPAEECQCPARCFPPRLHNPRGCSCPHPPILLSIAHWQLQTAKPHKAARFSFLKHVNALSSFPAWRRRARLLTHAKGRAKAAETAALTRQGNEWEGREMREGRERLRPPARLLLPRGVLAVRAAGVGQWQWQGQWQPQLQPRRARTCSAPRPPPSSHAATASSGASRARGREQRGGRGCGREGSGRRWGERAALRGASPAAPWGVHSRGESRRGDAGVL